MSTPTPTLTHALTPTSSQNSTAGGQLEEDQVISTPTLASTVTPGPLEYAIEEISRNTGIDNFYVFSLSGENLVNLLLSVFIVLVGSLAGWLLVKLSLWIANITPPRFDDQLLAAVENQVNR